MLAQGVAPLLLDHHINHEDELEDHRGGDIDYYSLIVLYSGNK